MAGGDRAPLRVLMVTPRSPRALGGVERHVMEVSRRMAAAGLHVEVICTEPGRARRLVESHQGVRITTLPAHPAQQDWCLAPSLWSEMTADWDVVHVQSYHTFVAPMAMLRAWTLGIPYVLTFHGGGHSSGMRNRLRTAQRRLLRPLLARAARLVAVARFEIAAYGRELHLPHASFALIPNGMERHDDEGLTLPERGPRIASVGRLERYKGHHRVIEAFPFVLAEHPGAELFIVGRGPYEPTLRAQVSALGEAAARVTFTSVASDDPRAMHDFLQTVRVTALMSEFETHPIVALEAGAAGCQSVVADVAGLSEVAGNGFATAIPLDSSAEEIAAAILDQLGQPPPSGRPTMFSWEECTAALIDLYRDIGEPGGTV